MIDTTAGFFKTRVEHNRHPATEHGIREVHAAPGFGQFFADHMALANWTSADGWHDDRVVPYGPFVLAPASAALHYAQEIFEGLKAYRHEDGSVHVFRPTENAIRFQRSAARMMLPELPVDWFLDSIDALLALDAAWVPDGGVNALYLRPFMFGSDLVLGMHSSRHVTYAVIATPVSGYLSGSGRALSVWVGEKYTRAAAGGTGAAKTGGNYAGSLLPLAEAAAHGCDQVVFLDGDEHRYVEELSAMNLFFVFDDGSIVTPASASILDGITRRSLIDIARDAGHVVTERPLAIEEWKEGAASGRIAEVFACGTAAVVTPIGRLVW